MKKFVQTTDGVQGMLLRAVFQGRDLLGARELCLTF